MKYAINASKLDKPLATYSHGVTAGRFIFISGQTGRLGPLDVSTTKVSGLTSDVSSSSSSTIALELSEALQKIETLLKEVDCSREDIAKMTIYLLDLTAIPIVDKVLSSYFSMPAPACSFVGVCELPQKAHVQVECIACR